MNHRLLSDVALDTATLYLDRVAIDTSIARTKMTREAAAMYMWLSLRVRYEPHPEDGIPKIFVGESWVRCASHGRRHVTSAKDDEPPKS